MTTEAKHSPLPWAVAAAGRWIVDADGRTVMEAAMPEVAVDIVAAVNQQHTALLAEVAALKEENKRLRGSIINQDGIYDDVKDIVLEINNAVETLTATLCRKGAL